MNELDIQIDEGRTAFEPGETIGVNLEWSLPRAPSELQLCAVWNTVGKGTTDVGTEQSMTIDSPGAAESRRVEFKLPAAPYSFSGRLISLVWALELVAGRSNSFRKEITIAPGASEVLLNREGEGGE
jgi:hypothetical protein